MLLIYTSPNIYIKRRVSASTPRPLKIYSATSKTCSKPSKKILSLVMTSTVDLHSEREPLIRGSSCSESTITSLRTHSISPTRTYGSDRKSSTSTLDPPGPLEISSTSRHGILAGIWLAQFLSVRLFLIIF